MSFEKFKFLVGYKYDRGWDKYAIDYNQLLKQNTVYYLTKQLMYSIVDMNKELEQHSEVLDIGCGTGNDFPFFLSKNTKITAFDMSKGMLNKASETYKMAIKLDLIDLYHGRLENLNEAVFNHKKFDVIYSVTGGLAYIDDVELQRVLKVLKTMLKPNGKIITAHFNRFCLSEILYNLIKFKFSLITQRKGEKIKVVIKDEEMFMYLRKATKLKTLCLIDFEHIKSYPLLAITPPFQTGFNPGSNLLSVFKKFEMRILKFAKLSCIADQFVMVLSNDA